MFELLLDEDEDEVSKAAVELEEDEDVTEAAVEEEDEPDEDESISSPVSRLKVFFRMPSFPQSQVSA